MGSVNLAFFSKLIHIPSWGRSQRSVEEPSARLVVTTERRWTVQEASATCVLEPWDEV